MMKKYFLFILIIFVLTSCSKYAYQLASKHTPFDAVIVPGVPFNGHEWEDVMKMRVYWSYILYQRGLTNHIIYSGSAVYTPWYEAEIMKLYAVKLGIPEEVIYTDTLAEHSTENVWYSYKLAQKLGFKKLAIATDPFQNFVIRKFKRDHELNVRAIPIIFEEVDSFMRIESPIIDPKSAYVDKFKSIEERESKWKQLKGTLGLNIKE